MGKKQQAVAAVPQVVEEESHSVQQKKENANKLAK